MSSEYVRNTLIYKFKGGTANLFVGIQNSDMQFYSTRLCVYISKVQGGSNMTGTDLCVNKPHCSAAVRP